MNENTFTPPPIYAVCILILRSNEPFGAVGVARRTDPKSFGLIGGKINSNDASPIDAAIRECREESGIEVANLIEVYRRECNQGIVVTYMGDHKGEPSVQLNEPECRWCSFQELLSGRFGEYNADLFRKLGLPCSA